MSDSRHYCYCIVPKCKNTSVTTPGKQFIGVPRNAPLRKKWCQAIKRYNEKFIPLSSNSSKFCCEDHFDLPNDMENYVKHKIMGLGYWQLKAKKGVFPHIFDCQQKPRWPKRTTGERRRRLEIINDLLEPKLEPSSSGDGENEKVNEETVAETFLEKNTDTCSDAMKLPDANSVAIKTEPVTPEEMLYIDIDVQNIKEECTEYSESVGRMGEFNLKEENNHRNPYSVTHTDDAEQGKNSKPCLCSDCNTSCPAKNAEANESDEVDPSLHKEESKHPRTSADLAPEPVATSDIHWHRRDLDLSSKKSKPNEMRPQNDVRFGGWGHFPEYADKVLRLRCRHCCRITMVKCQRCQVHLCFTRKRNCFRQFHTRSREQKRIVPKIGN